MRKRTHEKDGILNNPVSRFWNLNDLHFFSTCKVVKEASLHIKRRVASELASNWYLLPLHVTDLGIDSDRYSAFSFLWPFGSEERIERLRLLRDEPGSGVSVSHRVSAFIPRSGNLSLVFRIFQLAVRNLSVFAHWLLWIVHSLRMKWWFCENGSRLVSVNHAVKVVKSFNMDKVDLLTRRGS